MRAIEGIRRSGVAIGPERTMREAAEIMERSGVGALAVLDGDHLVGIVTDRDLVRRGLARRLDPHARVDSMMSSPVVTIEADADLRAAYAIFRENAVRRLAVTERGRFVGVLSIDDLLINLSADLADLVRPVTAETIYGHRDSPVPATRS
ncbi:CBS domain-containing protein [Acidimicrobiia bacterium EGI L10123]|uniref:CBS domain-containing protein n=1 Tax=Salinilacustrithrix flava TaxID=2957203 RepID=UPI003D7C30C5|nr:CBS domain-containing protein [Acidimicrobiia bacterium EGI L10123]